jgi:hypothetical protein
VSTNVIAHAAAGPFAAACAVLAFAGIAKIRRPTGVGAAATALGLPSSPATVRALGLAEGVAALAGLTIGGAAAAAAIWDAFGRPATLGLPTDVRIVVVTKDDAEENLRALRLYQAAERVSR